jgi:DNA-binding FrmR family transcriptional regulator
MATHGATGNAGARDAARLSLIDDLDRRLGLIGGQVGGLRRMLAEERDCEEMLTQLRSVMRALDAVRIRVAAARMCEGADGPDYLERVSATERLLRMTR